MSNQPITRNHAVAIAAVAVFLVLGVAAFGLTSIHNYIKAGVTCIVDNQGEYRQVGRDTFNDLREAHGLKPIPEDVYPPPIPTGDGACDRFVKRRGEVELTP